MPTEFSQSHQIIRKEVQASLLSGVSPSPELLIRVFHHQYEWNTVYQKYCQYLGLGKGDITKAGDIPFLPISAFKHYRVTTGTFDEEAVFTSSGTTGMGTSRHYVRSVAAYLENCDRIWEHSFGPVRDVCLLALLPGYLERQGASLIGMADHFIHQSRFPQSGFYLRDHRALHDQLLRNRDQNIPTVLLGVTYALMDFAEAHPLSFPSLRVMETGGMKGQREELSKEALHALLQQGFGVEHICSEYGMTELMSQAYSTGGQRFATHASLQIRVTEINDVFAPEKYGKAGLINIIDLANLDTCCFIQTEDTGRMYADGTFEVIGRLDTSELRGCNLMVSDYS